MKFCIAYIKNHGYVRLAAFIRLFICFSFCFSFNVIAKEEQPDGLYVYGSEAVQLSGGERLDFQVHAVLGNYNSKDSYRELKVLYPFDESIFPPEIASPDFKWTDKETDIENWLMILTFDNRHKPVYVLTDKPNWTPSENIWKLIKRYSVQGPAQIVILGVSYPSQPQVVSRATFSISTSRDRVDASIMFRRVPPSFAYAAKNPETMEWCLADISSYEESPVVMSNQQVCGSCHTFSRDGRAMGMDMDYKEDKGAYFFTSVSENIDLDDKDFISWNDFPRAEEDGLQSSGLFSRISPDGEYIASTVNEIFFLIMLNDPYASQLFFPLQGTLAYYSKSDRKIRSLAGADLPGVIQTDPSWSQDGKNILFSRAEIERDYFRELGGKTIFAAEDGEIEQLNRQYPVQFNVYSIPFNEGKGGRAKPLPGASHNGKSNYFPRYSPDHKWIVFTQSATGIALQPDSKMFIMPSAGGEPRLMNCNFNRMNSWHTWSPNSKWLAYVSKENTAFTELFLTHIDENGNDSPPVLLSRFNKEGYAVNLPEFANIPLNDLRKITLNGN